MPHFCCTFTIEQQHCSDMLSYVLGYVSNIVQTSQMALLQLEPSEHIFWCHYIGLPVYSQCRKSTYLTGSGQGITFRSVSKTITSLTRAEVQAPSWSPVAQVTILCTQASQTEAWVYVCSSGGLRAIVVSSKELRQLGGVTVWIHSDFIILKRFHLSEKKTGSSCGVRIAWLPINIIFVQSL